MSVILVAKIVPLEERLKVIEALDANSDESLSYTFRFYKQYFGSDYNDIRCPGCRAQVRNTLLKLVQIWTNG